MDLSETIIPKSDQLNADDLIAGPLDIVITRVERGTSPEQPVTIHYQGGDGRPYKPCKSMRRVLVALWGPQAQAYVGRSLRLYRDDSVRFGGTAVGGIRISHASELDSAFSILLTTARAKRSPYKVEPLFVPRQTIPPAAAAAAHDTEAAPPETPPAHHELTFERVQYMREQGDDAAEEGTAALREFWRKRLTPAERSALKSELPTWKHRAAEIDAQTGQTTPLSL